MAAQRKISLSKALKVKNRLAGRLAATTSTISVYNSVVRGRHGEVQVAELDKYRAELVNALVDLKTAIMEGNTGVYRLLNVLEEKKSEVAYLQGLNTRHGTEPGYQGQTIEYVAVISKSDVDKRVKQLEKEIDELQDKIDAYNADGERLSIDARILELAS